MSSLGDRLTGKRALAIGLVVALTLAAVLLGDPLEHPEEGADEEGRRGLVGMPRVVWFSAIAIAIILALPPRTDGEAG